MHVRCARRWWPGEGTIEEMCGARSSRAWVYGRGSCAIALALVSEIGEADAQEEPGAQRRLHLTLTRFGSSGQDGNTSRASRRCSLRACVRGRRGSGDGLVYRFGVPDHELNGYDVTLLRPCGGVPSPEDCEGEDAAGRIPSGRRDAHDSDGIVCAWVVRVVLGVPGGRRCRVRHRCRVPERCDLHGFIWTDLRGGPASVDCCG